MNAVFLQLQFIFINVVKMQSDKQRQRSPLILLRWTFWSISDSCVAFFRFFGTDVAELVRVLHGKSKKATVEKAVWSNSIHYYCGQGTVEDEVLRMVFGDGHLGV